MQTTNQFNNVFKHYNHFQQKTKTVSSLQKKARIGLNMFVVGLYIAFFTGARPVLMLHGWPISMQLTNRIGINIAFVLIFLGGFLYIFAKKIYTLYHNKFIFKIKLWFAYIFIIAIYGYINGNNIILIVNELMVFIYLGEFLLLGGDDEFWQVIHKHLTFLFIVGFIFILSHFQIPMADIDELHIKDPTESVTGSGRFTWSIGYYMRPLIGSSLLLGMIGLTEKKMCLGKIIRGISWFLYFIVDVIIFKFRSPATFVILAIISFILIRPFLSYRLKPNKYAFFIVIGLLFVWFYSSTSSWEILKDRITIQQEQGEGLFGSRSREFHAFVSDLGPQVLIGRGLGGTFDASAIFYGAKNWATMHYGILVLLLKGGLPFLLLFLSFLRFDLFTRKKQWYQNIFNITTVLLFPIFCLRFSTIPFFLASEAIFIHLPAMLVLSRLQKKEKLSN